MSSQLEPHSLAPRLPLLGLTPAADPWGKGSLVSLLARLAKVVLSRKVRHQLLAQETRKVSCRQPKATPQATRERRTNRTQLVEGKKIIEIKPEISEIQMKKTVQQISEIKVDSLKR